MEINYNKENENITKTIKEELIKNDITEFFIQNRVKDKESIKKKLQKKDEYGNSKEITDYSGVRIIVNRLIEIRICIEIIANHFQVDYSNSNFNPHSFIEDKEFGYRSSHLVVINNEIKTEVQIRTFAQHIWASTSHNLAYKVPVKDTTFPRKLFRLSSLLEQIDIITEDLYETSPLINQSSLKNLGRLDHYSLEYFLSRKERIFTLICLGFMPKSLSTTYEVEGTWSFSMKILNGSNKKDHLDIILYACKQLGLKTVEDLKCFIEENSTHIKKITSEYHKSKLANPIFDSNTLCFFYFLIVFISEPNVEKILKNEAHPAFISNLKEFVKECKLNPEFN